MLWNIAVIGGETIKKPYPIEKAFDVRDALVKSIYGRVFGWICSHINQMLAPNGLAFSGGGGSGPAPFQEIGILDIFGFENFEKNSFEQLCINVTNEQLQNFFNKHIFENELEEYRREGIDAAEISFVDNGRLLDMFFAKPIGTLGLCLQQRVQYKYIYKY